MINGYHNTYNILKEQKREEYTPIIFKSHYQFWMYSFILSDLNFSEKTDLLKNIALLFEEQETPIIEFDNEYYHLYNKIANKEFETAILLSDVIAIFKKREIKSYDKYLNLQKNYQEKHQSMKKLQKRLNIRKKQVAELQTVSGWINYKIKNIFNRLKQKIKS